MEGILVPLITPFAADGTIAVDALAALADDVLTQGAAGIAGTRTSLRCPRESTRLCACPRCRRTGQNG